ncbi:hypothetical protein PC116_g8591 [Phytophthora cactorum]|nr:hypothetical protein PC114_g6293 [Phytophthora cactorum]KAG3181717.1 hypothetical protein C6341_g6293 [Phytophthora cactorum]KAG4243539.1 hypothetical protein PC116_g8591 [Phytophthora cactorum]
MLHWSISWGQISRQKLYQSIAVTSEMSNRCWAMPTGKELHRNSRRCKHLDSGSFDFEMKLPALTVTS